MNDWFLLFFFFVENEFFSLLLHLFTIIKLLKFNAIFIIMKILRLLAYALY